MVKGVYILTIAITDNISVDVGALGRINFENGLYVYVGSAQSTLEKRIERHYKKVKRMFWHIDYLLSNDAVKLLEVFYKNAGKTEECKVARKLDEKGLPIKYFGSSDCSCISHLFKVNSYQVLREFIREMTFTIMGRNDYG